MPSTRPAGRGNRKADVLWTSPIHVFRHWPSHTDATAFSREEQAFIHQAREHLLDDQLRVYAAARRVVFAKGSAVYALSLLAPDTLPDEIVCVQRRRPRDSGLRDVAALFPERRAAFRDLSALAAEGLFFPRPCDALSVIDIPRVLRELGLADDAVLRALGVTAR